MNKSNVLQIVLTLDAEAFKMGLSAAGTSVRTMAGGASTAFATTKARLQENLTAVKNYNTELGRQSGILQTLKGNVTALVGAYLGFQSIAGIVGMMKEADSAAFTLEASLRAANREFSNIGDANEWGNVIDRLSTKLRIYSKSELKTAAAATVDMTKRLGLSKEQMEEVIERTADLSAGKTDLQGGIERVTAALRGEAEASEYLGLTLNETYVKAWHEAHNASGIAWKDLDDLQKAQVRYNVFLEQAGPLAGKAADSVKTFAGAYALAKKEISDAVEGSEDAKTAMKGLAEVIADNADEIGQLATMIVTAAAKTMEFVLAHKEVVIGVGLLTAGAGTLAFTISSLTTIWQGLNGVMLLTTGSKLLPWLGSIVTTLKGVQLAALGATGALGAAAGASLALIGGYSLGSKIAEWEYFRDVVKGNKDALAEVPAKFAAITQATGVSIRSFEDLNKAQREGLIRFNDATGAWEKVTKSAQESAAAQVKAQASATDEMKQRYKEFADEVKGLFDELAGEQKSLESELREMGREGMGDLAAWKDLKSEADEYFLAAEKAAKAGNFDEAKQLADEAKAKYKELNGAVEENGRILLSEEAARKAAMAGVREAGELKIRLIKEQIEAEKQAAQALDAESGGQLSKELPEVAKQFGELKTKADDLAGASAKFNDDWNNAWSAFLADGKKSVAELDSELSQLTKDRHIKVYVEEVEKKAKGGLVGYMRGGLIQALATGGRVARNILAGGHLPGFGGGDRRLLYGEDGEVMINKQSVAAAGLRASLAFNAGNWGVVISELMQRFRLNLNNVAGYHLGGVIGSQPGLQTLADGGQVTASASPGDTMTINLNFGRKTVPITTTRLGARDLIAELRRAEVLSS